MSKFFYVMFNHYRNPDKKLIIILIKACSLIGNFYYYNNTNTTVNAVPYSEEVRLAYILKGQP